MNYYLIIRERLIGITLFLTLIFSISFFSSEPLIRSFLKHAFQSGLSTKNMISRNAHDKETSHSGKMNALIGNHVITRTISDSLFGILVKFVNESQGQSLRSDLEKTPIEKIVPSFTVYPGDLKSFNEYCTIYDLKNRDVSGPVIWFRHFGPSDTNNLNTILLYARFLAIRVYLLRRFSSEESLLFIFPKNDLTENHNLVRSETPFLFILPKMALLNPNVKNRR